MGGTNAGDRHTCRGVVMRASAGRGMRHGGISGTVAGNGSRDGQRVALWRTRKHEAACGSMPALQAHSREQARMNLCVEEL
jgi:hypothetical protein